MKYLVLVRMDRAYFHLKLEEAHLTDPPTDYNLKLWTKYQKQLPGTCTKADTLWRGMSFPFSFFFCGSVVRVGPVWSQGSRWLRLSKSPIFMGRRPKKRGPCFSKMMEEIPIFNPSFPLWFCSEGGAEWKAKQIKLKRKPVFLTEETGREPMGWPQREEDWSTSNSNYGNCLSPSCPLSSAWMRKP